MNGYLKDNKEKKVEAEKVTKDLELFRKRLDNGQMMTLDGDLDATEYRNIKAKLEPEVERLIRKQTELNCKEDNVEETLEYGFHFLRNLPKLFAVATLEERSMILGSTFPEKLIFKDGVVQTTCPDSANSELIRPDTGFSGNKKREYKNFCTPFRFGGGDRNRTGVQT